MLDYIFVLLVIMAVITLVLSIFLKNASKDTDREGDVFWNITFIAVSTGLWFILALFTTGGIETPYVAYNSTVGNSTMYYSVYAPAPFIYLAYFFGLMACLCIIYLIVTIFGYYYAKLDEQNNEREREMQD